MIIISDTPPIRYLVEIEKAHILQSLFGRVVISEACLQQHAAREAMLEHDKKRKVDEQQKQSPSSPTEDEQQKQQ